MLLPQHATQLSNDSVSRFSPSQYVPLVCVRPKDHLKALCCAPHSAHEQTAVLRIHSPGGSLGPTTADIGGAKFRSTGTAKRSGGSISKYHLGINVPSSASNTPSASGGKGGIYLNCGFACSHVPHAGVFSQENALVLFVSASKKLPIATAQATANAKEIRFVLFIFKLPISAEQSIDYDIESHRLRAYRTPFPNLPHTGSRILDQVV